MIGLKEPYIIAETAFHHEGDVDFLLKLIDDLVELEISAIKFHLLFDLEDYIIDNHPARDVLTKIIIPKDKWIAVFDRVMQSKKRLILLCNDTESLKFVNSLQDKYTIDAVEIHSTGLNDIFLLEESTNFNNQILLGVGGSTFDEVKYAIDFLNSRGKENIILMHGFQSYPTDYNDINFNRLSLLKEAFGLPLGYADHTSPLDKNNAFISVLPLMNGVKIIEKHVTNKFGVQRIDSQAAVSLDTMKDIISLAGVIVKSLGTSTMNFSEAELNYGNTGPMKKALVAKKKIIKGEMITEENIAFKRTVDSSPLLQKDLNKILGNIALNDIEKDSILTNSNIEYTFNKPNFNQFFVSDNN